MKLLIDNNLSYKLCTPLCQHFSDVHHVTEFLSADADDIAIWNYAKANNFHILTKDNDFDEWSLLKGCPPKIIHLLCGNQTTLFILNIIVTNKKVIHDFITETGNNCILKLHL
jgi:predicted nuclease of predicted toxin-antitoxin system